jgi:ketosteroid isomerase-like protein
MSEENVEIVRRAWDAWQRGDFAELFALYDSEIVYDLTHYREWPESIYRGHQGIRQFIDE